MDEVAQEDWLTFARSLAPSSIDLLYADPPFNTGKPRRGVARGRSDLRAEPGRSDLRADPGTSDLRADIEGNLPEGKPCEPAELSYDDSFPSLDDFIDWLRDRLEATLPALKPTASILLHLDQRTSHRARCLLDDLLGPDRFVNHLIWTYGLGGSSPRRFARKHDDILFYCLDPNAYYFDPPMVPATSNRMKGQLKKAADVIEIPAINNMAHERVGYPTQKPLALLKLLVQACCPPGGVVLDPMCGSGTTLVAASKTARCFIGIDVNPEAVKICDQRLHCARPRGYVPI